MINSNNTDSYLRGWEVASDRYKLLSAKIEELEAKIEELTTPIPGISDSIDLRFRAYEAKIETLEKQLQEAVGVIEFYHQWCRDDLHCDLICAEPTDKRARDFLAKMNAPE